MRRSAVSLLSDDVDLDGDARNETERAGGVEPFAKSAVSVANPRDAEGFRVCVPRVRLPAPSHSGGGERALATTGRRAGGGSVLAHDDNRKHETAH